MNDDEQKKKRILNYVDELGHNIMLLTLKTASTYNEQLIIDILQIFMENDVNSFEKDLFDWNALEIAYEQRLVYATSLIFDYMAF